LYECRQGQDLGYLSKGHCDNLRLEAVAFHKASRIHGPSFSQFRNRIVSTPRNRPRDNGSPLSDLGDGTGTECQSRTRGSADPKLRLRNFVPPRTLFLFIGPATFPQIQPSQFNLSIGRTAKKEIYERLCISLPDFMLWKINRILEAKVL
jgi:hypothetical protein